MRFAILTLCALVALGVFATMFAAIWSSRRDGSDAPSARQHLAMELVWAAIPCLMIVAAAIPAVIAIAAPSAGDSRALSGNSQNAQNAEPLKSERATSARSWFAGLSAAAGTRK